MGRVRLAFMAGDARSNGEVRMKRLILAGLAVAFAISSAAAADKKQLVFVVNGASDF